MDVNCLKVGLTGGIASGKTTVSNLFAQHNVTIIDADLIAREVVQPQQPAFKDIVQLFGDVVIGVDGHLRRDILRQQIFSSPDLRQQLEAILHPRIKLEMQQRAAAIHEPYCILSIPLLIEAKQLDLVDRVLVVDCPIELQRQRLAQRDGITAAEIDRMLAAQASREQRLAVADDVIDNQTHVSQLQQQVQRLHQQYGTGLCEKARHI